MESASPSSVPPHLSKPEYSPYKMRDFLPCLPHKESARTKTVQMGQSCEGTLFLRPGPKPSGRGFGEALRLCLMVLVRSGNPVIGGAPPKDWVIHSLIRTFILHKTKLHWVPTRVRECANHAGHRDERPWSSKAQLGRVWPALSRRSN